jgi:hypothetical protein
MAGYSAVPAGTLRRLVFTRQFLPGYFHDAPAGASNYFWTWRRDLDANHFLKHVVVLCLVK